ncbi:MAG TPA: tRNA epoxyqueuosine(34) reductase QueG [Caulobacteraceae bacterium]|jgi:epoxyqueuosine reductase
MTTSTSEAARAWIRERAQSLGFEACGFASAEAPWEAGGRLKAFLREGRHGSMEWMARTAQRREHPTRMWPDARSAVVVGLNYGPAEDPREDLALRDRGLISAYARNRDYHELIKGRLKTLAGQIARRWSCEAKVFVDTAPLMEKPLAERAGVGWQGKHTNLVSRRYGSWLFLGSILTSLHIEPDPPEEDHCGACRACLDACPTAAFPAPYQLDARRCLSYLTIEHDGPIPESFRVAMGNRIYGCDDCLAACPWNKFASEAHESALHARDSLRSPSLESLCELDDAAFRKLFSGSAVKRIGRDRFVRNVLYAIGNSGDPGLAEAAAKRLGDASAMVREAASWALRQLAARLETDRLAAKPAPKR